MCGGMKGAEVWADVNEGYCERVCNPYIKKSVKEYIRIWLERCKDCMGEM